MLDRLFLNMHPKKLRLLKRFFLIPCGVLVVGGIFPFFPAFVKSTTGHYVVAGCLSTPDPRPLAFALLALTALWTASALPIFTIPIKNAIYVRLVLWLGGVLILLVFPIAAMYNVLYNDLAPVGDVLLYAIPSSILAAIVPIWLLRTKFQKMIEINNHAFDFNRMRWAVIAPLQHVGGKTTTSKIAVWTLGAGFVGALLAKFLSGDGTALSQAGGAWGESLLFWGVGWTSICLYGGGDLYVTWLVWRKSRVVGRPMLVDELLEESTRDIKS